MIVAAPRLVGTATVAEIFGITPDRVRHRVVAGDFPTAGYLGKIAGKHTWNLHEVCAAVFTDTAALELVVHQLTAPAPTDPLEALLCAVTDCDQAAELVGLCKKHLRRLMTSWRHAPRSSLVTIQLVAMCQWVVERNAHITLPPGFDPWAPVCMTPGCGGATNIQGENAWHGPLCLTCSAKFWGHVPGSRRGLFAA